MKGIILLSSSLLIASIYGGIAVSNNYKNTPHQPGPKANFQLAQSDPVTEMHSAMVNGLLSAGAMMSSINVQGNIGRYAIGTAGDAIEWELGADGSILHLRSFVQNNLNCTLTYNYDVDGYLQVVVAHLPGQDPITVGEVDKNEEGEPIGFWNYAENIYWPISIGNGGVGLLAQTYQDCMRDCNFAGKQCTDSAKFKAAQDSADALAAFGATVVAGTVAGSIAPAIGTAAGFIGGTVGGGLYLGFKIAQINAQLKFDLKQCRDAYNHCVKGCESIKPKKVGTL